MSLEATMMQIQLKRAYEKPSSSDGCRVLVDGIWPRGVSKKEARIDHWIKEIAPSTALRKWFTHDVKKWQDFKQRYTRELDGHPEAVAQLLALARKGEVTLIYASRERTINNAVALKDYLENRFQ